MEEEEEASRKFIEKLQAQDAREAEDREAAINETLESIKRQEEQDQEEATMRLIKEL